MPKLISYLSILLMFAMGSCQKDEDDNRDPCSTLNCQNGGTCVNGSCDCPPHYTGTDCGQQITPLEISINKIEVSQHPLETPDGRFWDEGWCIGSLPDLYLEVYYGNGKMQQSRYYSEAQADTVYTFSDSLPLVTSDVNTELKLSLYDRDTGFCVPSDSLGMVKTMLYTSDNDFPNTLELIDLEAEIRAKVFIEYTF